MKPSRKRVAVALVWFAMMPARSVVAGAAGDSVSKPLLKFIERDRDGGRHELNGRARAVDINSVLEIHVDREALRVLAAQDNPRTRDLLDVASKLQQASDAGLAGMGKAAAGVAQYSKDRNPRALQAALANVAEPATGVLLQSPRGSRLRKRLNEALELDDKSPLSDYLVVFRIAAEEAKALIADVEAVAAAEGVYVQFGAWIGTARGLQPVHLPGFDDYPVGERYLVERWHLALPSPEEFRALQVRAREINEQGVGDFLRQSARQLLDQLQVAIRTELPCLKEVESALAVVRSKGGDTQSEVRAALRQADDALENLRATGYMLIGKYERFQLGSRNPVEVLSEINADVARLRQRIDEVVNALHELLELPARLPAGELKKAVESLSHTVSGCVKQIRERLRDLVAAVATILVGANQVREINTALLEFGAAVKKLDLTQLPEQTQLDLTATGRREDGDAIAFKLAMGRGAEARKDLEARQFALFRVLTHLDSSVGVIFARHAGKFETAPAYSILLKRGSRKNLGINRFWNPGLGLNLAALDFNNDKTPEMGAGLTASFLRNYVQGGFGFNVNSGRSYGFFGLRLPMPR